MKNTFGQNMTVTLFGESHGAAVGAVIDGLTPGLTVDTTEMDRILSRRRPQSAIDTPRREPDHYQILSGVFNGKTTGTPLCIMIPNENTHSADYAYGVARPAHADYTAFCKYHGYEDYRGGGHFSGRITAALVAVGGILLPTLNRLGIYIGTHILQCGDVQDRAFSGATDLSLLQTADFPVLDPDAGVAMSDYILSARQRNDSVGGVTQTAICGLVPGLGEPWFDSVEGLLSHAVFSLGGIKGIEFGAGFGLTKMTGSQSNDPFRMEAGRVVTETNMSGGINGGITNGMPVVFQCAVKPTPSIAQPQKTVDFKAGTEETLTIHGRHDPAIIRRICPVLDSVAAMVVCDLLIGRFGTDILLGGIPSCNTD